MRRHLLTRILGHYTLLCYLASVILMCFLAGGHRAPLLFFLGFSPGHGVGGLDLIKTMEWNLCVLPPVSASILFLIPELGTLSTYTILRSKTISRWWLMRLAGIVIINYAFFFFALLVLALPMGNDIQWSKWAPAVALFPLHTTLLSILCGCGILLFSSRAATILYLLVEGGLLVVGMVYPPGSLFLIPYWGMAQTMGGKWMATVLVSLFLLIALNFGILCWLNRHNPAANPQNK